MELSRFRTAEGPRWGVDGRWMPRGFSLGMLLELPLSSVTETLNGLAADESASGPLQAPIEPGHEAWAAGVTYLRSREARRAESEGFSDAYARVYEADRPELFFKASGGRVVGPGAGIRVRADSAWSVPEPELVVVANRHLEIVGYSAGNDVSARDIEGDNLLYLPQAKMYERSCALGPSIRICERAELRGLPIRLEVRRGGRTLVADETSTDQMKRDPDELLAYLGRELSFPQGVFLMTGTGIVPPSDFSLTVGDEVTVRVGPLELTNPVEP